MRKILVVNADDYGMTLGVSRGIIEAARAGLVRAACVMTNCPEFEDSMGELQQADVGLDIGFHANLTWGRPVSDPAEIPSLVGPDGNFLSRGTLLAKSLAGLVSPEEGYRELWAQCAKLAARMPAISHMNGHHHVHAFPGIAAASERVAREYGIPYVRSPREGMWSPWQHAALRRFAIFMLAGSSPEYWRARGFVSSDNFGGFSLSAGRDLKARWIDTMERTPNGTTEMMVHPGYSSDELDSYGEGRDQEIAVLCDPELRDAAARAGVEISSFTS